MNVNIIIIIIAFQNDGHKHKHTYRIFHVACSERAKTKAKQKQWCHVTTSTNEIASFKI